MGRKFLAITASLITAIGIILIGEMVSLKWTEVPVLPGKTPEAGNVMSPYMTNISGQGLLFLGLVHSSGAFAAGFIATKMARRFSEGSSVAMASAALLIVYGLVNFFVAIPYHPLWFSILCLVLYFPMAMFGYKLAHRVGHAPVVAA